MTLVFLTIKVDSCCKKWHLCCLESCGVIMGAICSCLLLLDVSINVTENSRNLNCLESHDLVISIVRFLLVTIILCRPVNFSIIWMF